MYSLGWLINSLAQLVAGHRSQVFDVVLELVGKRTIAKRGVVEVSAQRQDEANVGRRPRLRIGERINKRIDEAVPQRLVGD